MERFFNYNWKSLKAINFMDCKISDKEWRLLVDNALNLPNIKEIKICNSRLIARLKLYNIIAKWRSLKL